MTTQNSTARLNAPRSFSTFAAILSTLLVSALLIGCNKPSEPAAPAQTPGSTDEAANDPAAAPTPNPAGQRVVSLGGDITEIVFALGAGDRVVGIDMSGRHVAGAADIPQVGYHRSLSAEGVLSLSPTVVLGTPSDGSAEALQQIRAAGANYIQAPNEPTAEGAYAKIRAVAEALNLREEGEALVETLRSELQGVAQRLEGREERPRVLFIYARGHGTLLVAGAGTEGDAVASLAGGVNAADAFEGYRTLTPEAVVAAAPALIVFPKLGLDTIGGIDGALALPGVSQTPAAQNRNFVEIDDLALLGFAPSTGRAIAQLAAILHPEAFEAGGAQ